MELTASIPLSKIKKIELYQNTKNLYMSQIKTKTGADYVINGGIFSFQTFKPFCNVKRDGKVLCSPGYTEYGFAWNDGTDISYEVLPSKKNNYLGCVGMILNGAKQKMNYKSDMGGCRQRSAIGIKDGNLILYACNGVHSKTPEKLQDYAVKQGWKNGLMLDGGGSTQAIFPNGTLKSTENKGNGRVVQNYILVYLKKESVSIPKPAQNDSCPYAEPTVSVKSGTRGESAMWVQWHLNKTGWCNLVVDGVFGKNSVSALRNFQRRNNLKVDGICGQATRNALKSVCQKGE